MKIHRVDNREVWVDYLKVMITALVVAHHSMLAYTTFARFDPETYINSTHPIVDSHRIFLLDVLQNFNDVFFMALMFLIGGLFISKSIEKKGYFTFVRDRFYRLLMPFFLLGTLFMLIAYFPSFYVANQSLDLRIYITDFFYQQKWPTGPTWFIGILFCFSLLVLPFQLYLKIKRNEVSKFIISLGNRPFFLSLMMFSITWLLYVPLIFLVDPGTWVGYGPFDFQLSRVLLYYGYFSIGVILGNTDFNNGIFSLKSGLVGLWKTWIFIAVFIYIALITIGDPLKDMVNTKELKEVNAKLIYYTVHVASCVFSSIAFLITSRKFLDFNMSCWECLRKNSYLTYLVHYIFVIWIQFLLLDLNVSAFVKFIITFISSFTLSLIVATLLRKVKPIKKYL